MSTSTFEEATSGLALTLPRPRDMSLMIDPRRVVYRKLLREHLSITSSHTYIHKELAPARVKEDIKAVGKLVELLKNVFTRYRSDNRSKC